MVGTINLGLMAKGYDGDDVQILKRQVEGRHCADTKPYGQRIRQADFSMAVANALADVPRANVLLDVSLTSEFLPDENIVCWRAKGNAGVVR